MSKLRMVYHEAPEFERWFRAVDDEEAIVTHPVNVIIQEPRPILYRADGTALGRPPAGFIRSQNQRRK